MAPLNPYAPLYLPTNFVPLFEYSLPPYYSVPPPPLHHLHYYFSFNQSPYDHPALLYSIPPPSPLPAYTAAPPYMLQSCFPAEGAACEPRPTPALLEVEEAAKNEAERGASERRVPRLWRKGSRGFGDSTGRWRSRGKRPSSAIGDDDLAFRFSDDEENECRTTVMIKNIPNKLSKEQLMELLDKHCREVAEKMTGADATLSEYDFLYLPMDFNSGSNLGYAFVNFTSAIAARRLHRAYHKRGWGLLGTRKVREVTYARIQGLSELLRHFRSSVFNCDSNDYLPVYFTPARDGARMSEQHCIGKRIPRS